MNITKTIIPAACFGQSFLPFTKTIPKEMLPLLFKPAIQYIVEESLQANIRNVVFITNKNSCPLINYFDTDHELKEQLCEQKKEGVLNNLEKIIRSTQFTYIRQPETLGLGHAILMAQHVIDQKEYFGIMLPDDIILQKKTVMEQLVEIANQEKTSVLAVQEVPAENFHRYSMVGIKKQITPRLFQVSHLVEKPSTYESPSNMAVVGRYVLSAKIFKDLREINNNAMHEIHLSSAISSMAKNSERILAYKIHGMRYDIGSPLGWLKATISLGLENTVYGPHLRQFLASYDKIESASKRQQEDISSML